MACVAAIAVFIGLAAVHDFAFWRFLALQPLAELGSSLRGILGGALADAALALGMALAAWGFGLRLMELRNRSRPMSSVPDFPLVFALGFGVLAEGVFALGLEQAFRPVPLGLWFGFAVLAGAAPAWRALRALVHREAAISLDEAVGLEASLAKGLLWGILAYIGWNVSIHALAPPVDWDVLAYHLSIPKLYWHWGGVREIPWLLHSHWPHLSEMFYTAFLALGRDSSAQFFHGLVCAVWLYAVYQAAKSQGGRAEALLAVTAIAAQPDVYKTAHQAHSDGPLVLFFFLAACAVWEWSKSRDKSKLFLAGSLAGLACSAKIMGLLWSASLGLWILFFSKPKTIRWKDAALFGLVVGAVVSPWLIKTWIGAGNPIWPFLAGLFGGRWGGPEIAGLLAASGAWTKPMGLAEILAHGEPQFLLGPALGLGILGLARGLRARPMTRFLLVQAVLPVAVLWPVGDLWRYLMPAYPAIGMLIGGYAVGLWRAGRAGVRLACAAFVLAAVGAPVLMAGENNALFPVFSIHSKQEPRTSPRQRFLERSLDVEPVDERINAALGPSSKVLLFYDPRGYYLDVPYQWGDPAMQGLILYSRIRNPDELRAALAVQGVTHVLVNAGLGIYKAKPGYYDQHTVGLMKALLGRCGRVALESGPIILYDLAACSARPAGA